MTLLRMVQSNECVHLMGIVMFIIFLSDEGAVAVSKCPDDQLHLSMA